MKPDTRKPDVPILMETKQEQRSIVCTHVLQGEPVEYRTYQDSPHRGNALCAIDPWEHTDDELVTLCEECLDGFLSSGPPKKSGTLVCDNVWLRWTDGILETGLRCHHEKGRDYGYSVHSPNGLQ